MRASRTLFAASVLLLTTSSVAAQFHASDHVDKTHSFVRITPRKLHPGVLRIHSTDALGWVNYSSKIARISFDKDVTKRMTCNSPGNFRLTGDRYESAGIQALQFASLCNLAPGEYSYRVELVSGIGGTGTGVPVTHEGRIVVEQEIPERP